MEEDKLGKTCADMLLRAVQTIAEDGWVHAGDLRALGLKNLPDSIPDVARTPVLGIEVTGTSKFEGDTASLEMAVKTGKFEWITITTQFKPKENIDAAGDDGNQTTDS